jgi:hypothetical protein
MGGNGVFCVAYHDVFHYRGYMINMRCQTTKYHFRVKRYANKKRLMRDAYIKLPALDHRPLMTSEITCLTRLGQTVFHPWLTGASRPSPPGRELVLLCMPDGASRGPCLGSERADAQDGTTFVGLASLEH